jgi:hypothetical protein
MGGKSSSKQETVNKQATTNLVNDGEYAGATDFLVNESDNSVKDSNNSETNLESNFESDSSVKDSNNSETNFESNLENNFESDSSVNDSNNSETNSESNFDFESDSSVNDSNNSETETNFETNTETNFESNFESDSSVNDSNNTDIDQEFDYSGENSGNSGTINVIDAGAIEAAENVAKAALEASEKQAEEMRKAQAAQNESNQKIVSDSLSKSFGFGGKAIDSVNKNSSKAIDSVSKNSSKALDEIGNTARDALGEVSEFGTTAIDTVSDSIASQASKFASGLTSVSNQSTALSQKILDDAADSNTEDKSIIADLARSTSLAGQDLVSSASEKMVLYIAGAVGLVGVSLAIAYGVNKNG